MPVLLCYKTVYEKQLDEWEERELFTILKQTPGVFF